MPEEQRHVAQWQRLTIYRYTLPPPYEATEHLFEELPLSTYPSGTTMEPLAYEMTPGAHLGRAAPWTRRWSCFLRVSHPGGRKHAPAEYPFVRRVTAGICVRMPPNGCPTHNKQLWWRRRRRRTCKRRA